MGEMKKLAVLRGDGVGRPCPFGLSVSTSCKNAGDSINDMIALETVQEEDREKQKRVNRRIYRHSGDGQPCPYLEGVVKSAKYDTSNCDHGDSNPGSHELPFRPSPYYPRIGAGFNINVLNGYGFAGYNDVGNDSYMSNFVRPAMIETKDFWLVDGELEKVASIDSPASVPQLAELGPPNNQWFQVHVINEAVHPAWARGRVEKSEVFDALESAKAWAENRKGPGFKVELEGRMSWWPPGAVKDEWGRFDYGFTDEASIVAAAKQAPNLVVFERGEITKSTWRCRGLEFFFRLQSLDGAEFTEEYRKFEEQDPQIYGMFPAGAFEPFVFDGPAEVQRQTLELKTASLATNEDS